MNKLLDTLNSFSTRWKENAALYASRCDSANDLEDEVALVMNCPLVWTVVDGVLCIDGHWVCPADRLTEIALDTEDLSPWEMTLVLSDGQQIVLWFTTRYGRSQVFEIRHCRSPLTDVTRFDFVDVRS